MQTLKELKNKLKENNLQRYVYLKFCYTPNFGGNGDYYITVKDNIPSVGVTKLKRFIKESGKRIILHDFKYNII